MPYLRNKNIPGQEQGLTTGGGVLGQGGSVGGSGNKTAAGSAGGWYNIQDFLGANQQTPAIRGQIEKQGENVLSGAEKSFQESQTGIQDLPTANKYDQNQFTGMFSDGIDQNEANQLSSNMAQQYNPTQSIQDTSGAQQNIEGIGQGFSGLMDWFGGAEKQSSNYTPGMQKMDEMLLRGQKDFVKDYKGDLQKGYQERVGDPMQAAQQDLASRQQAKKGEYDTANKQWFEGVQDYLGNQDTGIANQFKTMQEEEAARSGTDINSLFSQDAIGKASQFGIDPTKYAQYTGYAPTEANAAYSALGGSQGIQDYNTLANLLEQQGADPMQRLAGQEYNPGSWNVNEEGMMNEYNQLFNAQQESIAAQQRAQREAEAPARAEYDAMIREQEIANANQPSSALGFGLGLDVQQPQQQSFEDFYREYQNRNKVPENIVPFTGNYGY